MFKGTPFERIHYQGHSQNLKQVPQNFTKNVCIDDVTPTFQLMTWYRKINIVSKKIINYRVSSPSTHQYCQINIIVPERPGILVIIHFFCLLRRQNKIFELLELTHSYASLYQFGKKLTKHIPANIDMFKVRIVTLI